MMTAEFMWSKRSVLRFTVANAEASTNTVFFNRDLTEPLVFDGTVSGVRWKSFKILTLSGVYSGGHWPLDFGGEIGRRKT